MKVADRPGDISILTHIFSSDNRWEGQTKHLQEITEIFFFVEQQILPWMVSSKKWNKKLSDFKLIVIHKKSEPAHLIFLLNFLTFLV